jgi:hypothetical protein
MNSCLLQRRMEELPGVVVTTQRMITSRVAFLPETEKASLKQGSLSLANLVGARFNAPCLTLPRR